jgi:hypothetical protein
LFFPWRYVSNIHSKPNSGFFLAGNPRSHHHGCIRPASRTPKTRRSRVPTLRTSCNQRRLTPMKGVKCVGAS